ncbi:hybrid sensor histidine kinase/response regulator [Burkholderiaceae bacterium UC74_6]
MRLLPLWICFAFCALCAAGASGQSQGQQPQVRTLTQAEWRAPDGSWRTVDLPDDWRQRGLSRPGTERYRIRFEGAYTQDPRPWSLWSARFPVHHRVWLNGVQINDTWSLPDAAQPRTTPILVQLPSALLRTGANEILIEELGGMRSGLGTLRIGSSNEVVQDALAYRRVWTDLPRFLNGLSGGAGIFALLLWARRRSEVGIGWFGALSLATSVRNLLFLEPGTTVPAGGSIFFFLFIVLLNLLLGLFGASLALVSPAGARRFRVACVSIAVLALMAGLTAETGAVAIDEVRRWVYPVLLLNAAVSATLLCRVALRLPQRKLMLLAASVAIIVASCAFDMLLQRGALLQHWEFLVPWTTPPLALCYAALLGGRLVHALSESERSGLALEQRVRERTEALELANTAKARFLAAASHDLRQPMVTIGLLVGILREQLTSPAQQRLIGRVDDAVAAMEALLAGLLDLSRLDSGGLRVARERVTLSALLEAVAAHEREAAQRKGLQLRLRVPAGAVVVGDVVLIEQVLRNLVANALRYTERGGVLIGVRRRGAAWRISVWDTGCGIAQDQQARVFEDFVQLDNPQRDRLQGLGLGLAIVRRAVALLGAQVHLVSTPGRGSCFSVELPVASTAEALAAPSPLETVAAELGGAHVLLVEDDEGARIALQLRLQTWGARVQAFDSGAAVEAWLLSPGATAPALVVTDMRLPHSAMGNGLAVVAAVRAAFGPVPALIVTGNTAPQDMSELAASGLPVVHKPFRAAQLAGAINQLLAA